MKKCLSFLLAAALIFVLFACSINETESGADISSEGTSGDLQSKITEVESSNTDKSEISEAESNNTDKSEISEAESSDADKSEISEAESNNTDKSGDNAQSAESSNSAEESKSLHKHFFSAATCTEPSKCDCGAAQGAALGHEYDNQGKCIRCGDIHPDATEFITFADLFLENYVKQALGISAADRVSKFGMSRLTAIGIGKGVTNLADLKYATNLQSISIDSDNVQNTDILCSLTKITDISFGFHALVDVAFMKDMNQIQTVYFNAANLTNGTAADLVSSPNLKTLVFYDAWGVAGNELNFLEKATGLESAELWHCFAASSDISILETLRNLKSLKILTFNTLSEGQLEVFNNLMSKGVSVTLM